MNGSPRPRMVRLSLTLALGAALTAPLQAAETIIGTPDAQLCYEAAMLPDVAHYGDVKVCTSAIESGSLNMRDLAATYSNRGIIESARGRLDRALRDHEAALRIIPTLSHARLNRANVLSRLKRYDEALAAYEELLREDEAGLGHLTYFNRALLHLDRKDRMAARADLLKAVELAPDRRLYLNTLAELQ